MQQGIVENNPVVGTALPGEERQRERILVADEIRVLWLATEGSGDYNAILRLLLLTGQRREEIAGLHWSELNLERTAWLIPVERTKNKRSHEVPLSQQAAQIIRGLPRRHGRALVFGSGQGSFSGWSRAKARLDDRSGLSGWILHDLRRTVVTGMNELGIPPHVVEAVVNHTSGHRAGVAGIYNRATYASEKRSGLQAWADHIDEIVHGRSS